MIEKQRPKNDPQAWLALICIALILTLLAWCLWGCSNTAKTVKPVRDTTYRKQPENPLPKLTQQQMDSILVCAKKLELYRFKHKIWGETIRVAKVICFLRETARLEDPYSNDVTEPDGIRYIGKYAFSKDAIQTAENYHSENTCGLKVVVNPNLPSTIAEHQELLMDNLLLYFIDLCLARGIKPTSEFLSLCHWKGFDGALSALKGGYGK